MNTNDIDTFFFGPPTTPLFGCLHIPEGTGRDRGVVLSSPPPPEYARSHRPLRSLAQLLVRAGFPVLRFDYYGTGDSAGYPEGCRLKRWLSDLDHAVDALRTRAGVSDVALVGLRLGAALAARCVENRNDIQCLALWDSISGQDFLEQWRYLQLDTNWCDTVDTTIPGFCEIWGVSFSEDLVTDLSTLNVTPHRLTRDTRVLVLDGVKEGAGTDLAAACAQHGAITRHSYVPSPRFWIEAEQYLAPGEIIQTVADWIDSPE